MACSAHVHPVWHQRMRSYLSSVVCSVSLIVVSTSAAIGQQPMDTVRVGTRVTDRGGFTIEVIDRAAIDRLPALALPQLLARALGVDIQARSPASVDVAVRGGSYQQALILIDGVRVTDAQTAHFSLDLPIVVEDIERIEVLRGGASALYGPDAAGGVINIVSRHGASRSLSIAAGSFGTVRAALSGGVGNTHGFARGTAEYSVSDGARPGTDYNTKQVRISLGRSGSGTRLGFDGGWARRAFGANAFYGPYDSFETTNTGTLSARVERSLGNGSELRALASWRRHDDDFALNRQKPDAYRNLHTNTMLLTELSLRQMLGNSGAVTAGIEGGLLGLASARLGDRREDRIATFVEGAYRMRGATLTTAARVDHSSVTGTALSPSFTVRMPAADHYTVRIAISRGIRAPSWTERYYTDPANRGTPSLGVETFWTGDAAIGRTFSRGIMEVTVFGRRSHDLIDWTRPVAAASPQTPPWTARNVANATLHGMELSGEVIRLGGIDWRLRMQGTRFTTSLPEGTTGKYALRPLTRSGGLTATRTLGRRVSASIDILHSRRAGESAYTTADARLEWRSASKVWRMTIDGTNLANAGWLDVAGMSAPGAALLIGVGWTR